MLDSGSGGALVRTARNTSTSAHCWVVGADEISCGSAEDRGVWPAGVSKQVSSAHDEGRRGDAVCTLDVGQQVEQMSCALEGVAVTSVATEPANRGQSHSWKAADSGCY